MKDKVLWSIIVGIAILALLDWAGVRGDDLVHSVRRLTQNGDSRLLGWAVFALVAYSVIKIIAHISKS